MEKKVLNILDDDSLIKQTNIAERLSVLLVTVKRVMKKMQDTGTIERKGGKRFGYWEIHK